MENHEDVHAAGLAERVSVEAAVECVVAGAVLAGNLDGGAGWVDTYEGVLLGWWRM